MIKKCILLLVTWHCMCLCAMAQGAHWKITITPTGYTNYLRTTFSYPGISTATYPDPEYGMWENPDKTEPEWCSPAPIGFFSTEYNYPPLGDQLMLNALGSHYIEARWVDAFGVPTMTPPPPAKTTLKITSWAGWTAPQHCTITGTSASNGLDDQEIIKEPNPVIPYGMKSGNSYGIKLKVYNSSSGYFDDTVSQSVNITAMANPIYPMDGANYMGVYHTVQAVVGPIKFYHGTEYEEAARYAGYPPFALKNVDKTGFPDFGMGFYTVDDLPASIAMGRYFAAAKAMKDNKNDWGVVEFAIPNDVFSDFLWTNQAKVVEYRLLGMSDPAPTTAVPYYGVQPNSSLNTIPSGPLNWYNFSWTNWYLLQNNHPTVAAFLLSGVPSYYNYYIPYTVMSVGIDVAPDYNYALISGNFFAPGQFSIPTTYPLGGEWDRAKGLKQYVFGTGGGIQLLNNAAVTRTLFDYGIVLSPPPGPW